MAIRFFLVGAVASLGLSLPETRDVGTWAAMTQTWISARLAEGDVRGAEEAGGGMLASRLAESGPGELTRRDSAFDTAMEEMVHSFSSGRNTTPPSETRLAVPTPPTFEPMVIAEDLYAGTAYALNRASDGLNPAQLAMEPTRRVAEKVSGGSRGNYVPMVVGDDLYVGVAYSLNRASEGPGVASRGFTWQEPAEAGSEPATATPVSRLSVALRLTREAVYAWSNLLHGPAVVAISR